MTDYKKKYEEALDFIKGLSESGLTKAERDHWESIVEESPDNSDHGFWDGCDANEALLVNNCRSFLKDHGIDFDDTLTPQEALDLLESKPNLFPYIDIVEDVSSLAAVVEQLKLKNKISKIVNKS